MAHIFTERMSLTCPECGHPFTAYPWLIVDANERPDLIAQAREDTLHDVVCPRGHTLTLDLPLLIIRPRQSPVLIFSPADYTTDEQDADMLRDLLGRLLSRAAGGWQFELMTQTDWMKEMFLIPREQLWEIL